MQQKNTPTDQSSSQGQWERCGKIAPRHKEVTLPTSNVPQKKLKMEEPPPNKRLQPIGVTTSSVAFSLGDAETLPISNLPRAT